MMGEGHFSDLTARLAAADQGWALLHGDPPAAPDYERAALRASAVLPETVTGDDAIDIVARHIVARSYAGPAATVTDIDWGDYPEIGEHDWEAVCDRAAAIADTVRPEDAAYGQAYRLLADRSDREAS